MTVEGHVDVFVSLGSRFIDKCRDNGFLLWLGWRCVWHLEVSMLLHLTQKSDSCHINSVFMGLKPQPSVLQPMKEMWPEDRQDALGASKTT